MRIVYFGFDFFDEVLRMLATSQDHEVVAVFTKVSAFSRNVRRLAAEHDIPLHLSAFSLDQHQSLVADTDIFLGASYDSLIPLTDSVRFKLNLHPSLLPVGRGPAPLPWILNMYPQSAGVTLHEMTDRFDEGPIVIARGIEVEAQTSFERYCLECNLVARDLVAEFCRGPDSLFARRLPQSEGGFLGKWPEERFAIDEGMTFEQIETLVKRAGSRGASFFHGSVEYRITGCEPAPPVVVAALPQLDREFYGLIPCSDGAVLVRPAHLRKMEE